MKGAGPPQTTPFARPAVEPCPNANPWVSSCKKRTCRVCGVRWVKDVRTWLRVNLEAFCGEKGRVACIAITPPGKDVLPFDRNWDDDGPLDKDGNPVRRRCTHGPRAKCSGKVYGCQVEQRAAREWCETLTWRWGKLLRTVRQQARRAGLEPDLLVRVFEPQKRGIPHLHLVVAYTTPTQRQAAQFLADQLAAHAPGYGFGFVQTHLRGQSGAEAAAYLTSYFVGGSRKKPSIKDTVKSDLMPHSLIWVNPKLTAGRLVEGIRHVITASGRPTFVTMRFLRRARHLWAWAKRICETPPRWTDLLEAVKTGAAFRRAYAREPDEPPDVDAALSHAEYVQAKLEQVYDFNTAAPLIRRMPTREAREFLEHATELAVSLAGLSPAPDLLAAAA